MSTVNSNTRGTAGIIHQFWVALEKCYELQPGESLLMETEGDVSVEGRFQLELKQYDKDNALTSSDINIWNTLKNWMDDSFNPSKYRYLILRTTQPHGPRSIFKTWNQELDPARRKEIIINWVKLREQEYAENCRNAASLEKPTPEPSESLRLMREVVTPEKSSKLDEVAAKFRIETCSPDMSDTCTTLRNNVCRGIPEKNKNSFLNSLAGFIIRPDITHHTHWEISNESFNKQCEEATQIHCSYVKNFSAKHRSSFDAPLTDDQEQLKNSTFVSKIEEINHHDQIVSAIKDYSYAFALVAEDFQKYTISGDAYTVFEETVDRDFREAYSRMKRQQNKCSKDFYDEHTASLSPTLSGFEQPPKDFRNGVLHMHMNCETKDRRWNLNP